VQAARHFGWRFEHRDVTSCTITRTERPGPGATAGAAFEDKEVTFETLHTLEFNSTRKRSSVIMRTDQGKIVIYTKGADNIIKSRLSKAALGSKEAADTWTALDDFAAEGLRTLCIGKRDVPAEEYAAWRAEYHAAETSLDGRADKMAAIQDQIEVDLELLGATAIEDKLQGGVIGAIESLRAAGIKVWVLTGDKVDTAITISRGAALVTDDMTLLRVVGEEMDQEADVDARGVPKIGVVAKLLKENFEKACSERDAGRAIAVVADTGALEAMTEQDLGDEFLKLCNLCKSVVCARVSPDQKGQVVTLVRNTAAAPVCLAIGDGANDVNMIQKAHIGVGVAGKEGLQAVNTADYAIGQFSFLRKLLLVHGRWSARRMAIVTWYMFYKNALLVLPQWFYGWYNLNSGQTFYYDGMYQIYNMLYTLAPILIVGVLDQDTGSERSQRHPQMYADVKRDLYFSTKVFWSAMAEVCTRALCL
jgi:phospholipid-transporting ATPase